MKTMAPPTSPLPLFPDLLDRIGARTDTPRWKFWVMDSVYRSKRPNPEIHELRSPRVSWQDPNGFTPPSVTPWSVEIWHYRNRWIGEGKKRQFTQRIHVVKRAFADRDTCVAFAERISRRIEAAQRAYDRHHGREEAAQRFTPTRRSGLRPLRRRGSVPGCPR
jgi:hypothetical protein